MSRLAEYLAYHHESARAGDIDPNYAMLRYVCDRFELNVEQRYWLAFIYALTYCGSSTYYVYNEFPDFENVDLGRLQRWWDSRGRAEIICQTDRRWVRSMNLFVPAVRSYKEFIGPWSQQERFRAIAQPYPTPEQRYNSVYQKAKNLHSFGQFALFLYLEALHTITPLDLCPTDLDLKQAHSCRSGLLYAYDLDCWLTEDDSPHPSMEWTLVDKQWTDLKQRLMPMDRVDTMFPNIWNIETTLCAYKKFHRGKRYLGYYVDRQALEIAKMQRNVPKGVCWDVLWQFRIEAGYPLDYLVETEFNPTRLAKGLPEKWVIARRDKTAQILQETANAHQ